MSIIGIYESDARTEFIIYDDVNYKIRNRKATKPSSIYSKLSRTTAKHEPHLKQLAMIRPHNFVLKKDLIIDIMRYYHCENEYDNLLLMLNAETIDGYVFININTIEDYLSNIGAVDEKETEDLKAYFDNDVDSSDSDNENI